MRAKILFQGLRSAVLLCLSLGALLGCSSLQDYLPSETPTLPNAVAVNRALRLSALTHGDEPFHLQMQISPPASPGSGGSLAPGFGAMQAEIEIWWLNAITYRTEIRSAGFRQTRIVNGSVVDEQNIGSFYPRWIENFVDALFDPVPEAEKLGLEPGSIPISDDSHACISHDASAHDETAQAEICFQGKEPLLASGIRFNRYVAFDNFAAFGHQLIPRTLINDLPANTLLHGQILLLEALPQSAYPLLKAMRVTPLTQQIRTQFLPRIAAESMLQSLPPAASLPADRSASLSSLKKPASGDPDSDAPTPARSPDRNPAIVYVRTDLTGRVREAYTDRNDIYNQHQAAVARALQLRFRPLLVNGALVQMEAPIEIH